MTLRASYGPGAPAPPRRYEELEAYRGVAAITILIFHVYQYSGLALPAYVAVVGAPWWQRMLSGLHLSGVFFTLSGFLLFLPFARAALGQQAPPAARGFLIRRLIRILPLYYLSMLVVWAWRYVGYEGQLTDLLLHLSFTHTFHRDYIFWTIGPAWSLAVEVQFYLLLALFGPWAVRRAQRLRTTGQRVAAVGGLLLALAGASAAYKWWAFTSPAVAPTDWPYFYSLPARLDALALGMLLALAVAAYGARPRFGAPVARLLCVAGLALIGAAVMLDTASPIAHLYYSTVVAAGTVLLIGATTLGPRGSGWERALRQPALAYLGRISYGIFLLHEPIMIELGRAGLLIAPGPGAFMTNLPVVLALAVGAASLSYYLLERPCGELRHLFDREGRLIERYPAAAAAQGPAARSAQPPLAASRAEGFAD